MKIEVSNGEILDKLSILEIKKSKITESSKLKNILAEIEHLYPLYAQIANTADLRIRFMELMEINLKLWEIEDKIRQKEKHSEFDVEFILLARSVYKTNDIRASLKKEINFLSNSVLIEEKSYEKY